MSETTTVTEKPVIIAGAPYKEVTTTTATTPDPAASPESPRDGVDEATPGPAPV